MSNNTQPLAKVGEFFKKSGSLGLIAVVVIFGVVLLLLPSERGKKEEAAAPLAPPEAAAGAAEDFEERIASALSKIEGAGRVTVVLALHSDGEVHFATDRGYSEKTDSREQSEETVVVNSGSSVQTPVVARHEYPEYRGALVVSEGADNPEVKLAITQAVASLTGLGSDRVTVVKMKTN